MGNIQNIRRISEKKGISYAFICKQIGRSHGYLHEIASRNADVPMKMVPLIAKALGVSEREILEEPEQKEKTINQMADGLTEEKRKAIEIIMNASDENARKYLRMIETFEGIE